MINPDQLKVLAVDDNRTNLHIIKVFLNKLGHEAILAENGLEAVEKFQQERPDMVLMDIMMPVMDGFEAARQIKTLSQKRWVPLIFVSAMSRDENLVEGLEAGGDDYLTKPINFVVLEAKIRSMKRSLDMQRQAGESLKRLQTISDAVADVIVTLDASGTIQNCSRAVESIFCWAPKDLVGKPLDTLIPTARSAAWLEEFATTRQNIESSAVRSDGSPFMVEARVSEVTYEDSRMFVCILRDITERKQSEEKLRRNAEELQHYYEQTEQEHALAQNLVEMQLHRPGLQDPQLHYWIQPNTAFSGDMIAGARSPEGRLYALLADATGHGLGAAISALPVLSIFYRMTKLDRTVADMVDEINQQLKESIPTGRFVAMTLVCLEPGQRMGHIWIGGTPPATLYDRWGRPAQTFESTNLPLGILSSSETECTPLTFTWEQDSQLLLCSDGLLEAENGDGAAFGEERLNQTIAHSARSDRLHLIQVALGTHLAGNNTQDDVSLLLVDCP